jgi:hypothetical protein
MRRTRREGVERTIHSAIQHITEKININTNTTITSQRRKKRGGKASHARNLPTYHTSTIRTNKAISQKTRIKASLNVTGHRTNPGKLPLRTRLSFPSLKYTLQAQSKNTTARPLSIPPTTISPSFFFPSHFLCLPLIYLPNHTTPTSSSKHLPT